MAVVSGQVCLLRIHRKGVPQRGRTQLWHDLRRVIRSWTDNAFLPKRALLQSKATHALVPATFASTLPPWALVTYKLPAFCERNGAKSTFLSCLPVACILLQQQEMDQCKGILPSPDPGLGSASIGAFPDDIILSPVSWNLLTRPSAQRTETHLLTSRPARMWQTYWASSSMLSAPWHPQQGLNWTQTAFTRVNSESFVSRVGPLCVMTWYYQHVLSFSLWPGSKREDFFFRA